MLQFSANWNNESLTIVIIFTNKCVDNCMHEQHEQYTCSIWTTGVMYNRTRLASLISYGVM